MLEHMAANHTKGRAACLLVTPPSCYLLVLVATILFWTGLHGSEAERQSHGWAHAVY